MYQLGFAGSWETRLWARNLLSRGPSHDDEGGVRNRETGTTGRQAGRQHQHQQQREKEEDEEDGRLVGWSM